MKKKTAELVAVPLELKQANAFVGRFHRHHDAVFRDKYRVGAVKGGELVGVVQVGRPVSRELDDGATLEVTRLCTDGTPHVCSFLYSRAARIAKELGYAKIITYILEGEPGTSLLAAGWKKEADIRGHNWDCPSRPRQTTAPTCDKQRWVKELGAIPPEIDFPADCESEPQGEAQQITFDELSNGGGGMTDDRKTLLCGEKWSLRHSGI